jgi:hypothetical protein
MTLNLLETIEELEAYEIEVASKRQQHNVRYVLVERVGQVEQAGVVFTGPLPELLAQRLCRHAHIRNWLY